MTQHVADDASFNMAAQ